MNLRAMAVLTAVILAWGACADRAMGQNELPASAVTATDLPESAKEEIRKFVEVHVPGLAGTPAQIRRSRNALIEPLRNPQVSVAFRLEYARQLVPVLRPMIGNPSDVMSINALRLAGELATTTSLELLAEGQKDQRASVRYAAAIGYESTFLAVDRTSPAIAPPAQAVRAVTNLKNAIETEKDGRVLEAYVIALQAANKVSSKKIDGVRSESLKGLAQGISTRAKQEDAALNPAFRRAMQLARNALTNPDLNEPEYSQAILKDTAAMAGDVLAYATRRVQSGELAEGTGRAELSVLVADAERTVFFAHGKLGGESDDLGLGAMLLQGKDEDYAKGVQRVIGATGLLTGPPFGFADDRFWKP